MMTKEQFAWLMTRWEMISHDLEAKDEMINSLFDGWLSPITEELESLLCEAVSSAVGDTEDWISYFVYERGFDLSEPCVWDEDENVIATTTWADVYDLITSDDDMEDDEEDEL